MSNHVTVVVSPGGEKIVLRLSQGGGELLYASPLLKLRQRRHPVATKLKNEHRDRVTIYQFDLPRE